jgi:alpha-glucosidase (family GH31 glycosyl hydrolase)
MQGVEAGIALESCEVSFLNTLLKSVPITSGRLGQLRGVSRRGADIVFSFESSDLMLTPLGPSIIRHTWVPTHWRLHKQPPAQSHAVVRTEWPAAEFGDVEQGSDTVRVRCADLVIEASRDPFHLRYSKSGGKILLEEDPAGGLSWSYWQYALQYRLGADDHFYGMGQPDQLVAELGLDHRGRRHEIWNQHTPPAVTIFPAFLNPCGYGLLVDNPYKASWDLGCGDPAMFSYAAQGGPLQYYFFHARGLPGLLRTYFELTGFPSHPPRWIFGLMQSRYGYRNRTELEEIARTFRAKSLPCDTLILDLFWFDQMGDLAFNPAAWPQPAEMIARLKDQGFRIMVIEEPYVTEQSINYSELRDNGLLAKHSDGAPYTFDFWPGRCALVDFSNPALREWWTSKHRELLQIGIAGWWTDLNEPTRHFEDMNHHGGSASAVHNLNAFWMHQAIAQAHERYAPQRREFILSRSAYPGSQRYGVALWSGDVAMTFSSLRKQIAVGLSAGMAGIPFWGSDIGGFGFGGECTAELYTRWFQFGAFCPLFRPHGDQTELREPWQFGPRYEAICRTYLELRYRLLPYIYSCAHDACVSGLPLMRPLVLEFPDDPQVVNICDQYLFGPYILIAPVLEQGASRRSVYLPAGVWVDFKTGRTIEGPGYLEVDAPLEVLPLFIRPGAIIPMGPPMQYSGQAPLDPLTIEIYRGGDACFVLYEDDGETTAYRTGEYAETEIRVHANSASLSCLIGQTSGGFAGFQPERTIVINVHQQSAVGEVTCNGTPLAKTADEATLKPMAAGWWWNAAARILTAKFQRTRGASLIRIT